MLIEIIDNLKSEDSKTYYFDCKATTKEGLISAIQKRKSEIIDTLKLYFGDAKILCNGVRVGTFSFNAFACHGEIEVFKNPE